MDSEGAPWCSLRGDFVEADSAELGCLHLQAWAACVGNGTRQLLARNMSKHVETCRNSWPGLLRLEGVWRENMWKLLKTIVKGWHTLKWFEMLSDIHHSWWFMILSETTPQLGLIRSWRSMSALACVMLQACRKQPRGSYLDLHVTCVRVIEGFGISPPILFTLWQFNALLWSTSIV